MRTVAKILGGLVVVAVVLVVGAIVYVTTIDPATLIAPVQAQVKAATGRDLAVRGSAHIALSLHPRVVLTDVALTNAPWASTPDMIKAQRVELAFALVPLLSRRFEIEEIRLDAPQITLESKASGERNWQMQAQAVAGNAGGGGSNLGAAIGVGDVEIVNGIVSYRDARGKAPVSVTISKLSLGKRVLGSDMHVEFRGTVGDVAVNLTGQLGSFESLLAKRWPYTVDVAGNIDGQKFVIATKIQAEGQRYSLADLKLEFGANAINGAFAIDMGGARPKLLFDIDAPALVLSAIPLPVVPASAPPASSKPAHSYVIADSPVGFAPLRLADADGKIAIGKLTLANGTQYDNVRLQFVLSDGKLTMPRFSIGAFGGTLAGSVAIDASRADATSLAIDLDGKGLSLGAILAAAGRPREVRGGKSDVAAKLTMRGNSPHAWVSSANGNVRFVSGPATLVNDKAQDVPAWDKLQEAVNPFRARDPSTDLVCAVVRLPISNGVAHINQSIAMETSKLGVTASGTLDFRNETLDFTFQPKVKKGISIDVASLADLVRLKGSFASPQVAVDVASSAKVIASVGAAISTGGLSAVAQGLFSWAEGNGPGPCAIALGASAPQATQAKRREGNPPKANEFGKALNSLFGK